MSCQYVGHRDAKLLLRALTRISLIERASWLLKDRKKSPASVMAWVVGLLTPSPSVIIKELLWQWPFVQRSEVLPMNSLQKRQGLIPECFEGVYKSRDLNFAKEFPYQELNLYREASKGPESRPPKVCPSRKASWSHQTVPHQTLPRPNGACHSESLKLGKT